MDKETVRDVPWQIEAIQDQLENCGPLTASMLARRVGSGTVYTVQDYVWEWSPLMHRAHPDIQANQVLKIEAPPRNVVYFLWSQRYDVHERFGVGPLLDGNGDS